MVAIEVADLSAGYARDRILFDVSFSVPKGTVCALIGANGSGKTTLLRAIAGLCPGSGGRVRLLGEDIVDLDRLTLARRVALVPQRIEVAHGFSVREVVAMGRAPHLRGWLFATPSDEDIVDKTLASCDLAELADRAIETLSGGEQQRVHIARALAQRAPVLLLDEAAAHLDIRQVAGCYQLVRRLVRETELTCLAAMHDLSTAARHADNAVLLHDGKVIASGPIEAVMTDDHLSEAFGVGITSVSTTEGHRLFSC